jgi:hypothetical protein
MVNINMSLAAEAIRPFWARGINEISGHLTKGLAGWICDEQFLVYHPLTQTSAILSLTENEPLLSAIAYDCSRMALASLESIFTVKKSDVLPKSSAWTMLQTYYSAFFAAHAILRMLGLSCSQFAASEASSISRVAHLFGQANGISISSGFYVCRFEGRSKKITCEKTGITGGGVHEVFWRIFRDEMKSVSERILTSSSRNALHQVVSIKLDELCDNLSYAHCSNGSWLSFIRNEVNYRHRYGCWFPYKDFSKENYSLHGIIESSLIDPMSINLRHPKGNDLSQFKMTCAFIISLCQTLASDMASRCTTGKSFHNYGVLTLSNLIRRRHLT